LSKKFVKHYSNKSNHIFLPNFIDNEIYQAGSIKTISEIIEIKNRFSIPFENAVVIIPARLSVVKIHLFIDS
jgi:hypothetical protein